MAHEILETSAILSAAMVSRALLTTNSVVLNNHRDEAHGALKVSKYLKKFFELEQKAAGTNAKEWADAHRNGHHLFPDADLYPFREAYRAILYCQENGITVPERFHGFDRNVDEFSLDEMMAIGKLADDFLFSRMGAETPVKESYSYDEINALLYDYDDTPKYYYDESLMDPKRIYTDEEAAHILLRDQHSAALAPPRKDGSWNGVRYVLRKNVKLAAVRTRLDRQRPWLMSPDLRPERDKPVRGNDVFVAAGFAAAAAITIALERNFTSEGLAKSAAKGAAVNAGGLAVLAAGSSIVNAFGHMGVMTPETIKAAVMNYNFEVTPYEDGKYSSDTEEGGLIGKIMSIITNDESGKQRIHHLFPELIAYTLYKGLKGFKETPYGKTIEMLAESKYFPFFKRGDGLPSEPDGRRPDMTHPAVEMIENARARTLVERTQIKEES